MQFPRTSGILVHPTSLPGAYGMGEIGVQAIRLIDTLAAMREAKRKGYKVLAVNNVVGSTIARESSVVMPTLAAALLISLLTCAYSSNIRLLFSPSCDVIRYASCDTGIILNERSTALMPMNV